MVLPVLTRDDALQIEGYQCNVNDEVIVHKPSGFDIKQKEERELIRIGYFCLKVFSKANLSVVVNIYLWLKHFNRFNLMFSSWIFTLSSALILPYCNAYLCLSLDFFSGQA